MELGSEEKDEDRSLVKKRDAEEDDDDKIRKGVRKKKN
jgi:hypothetical protein